MSKNFGEEFLKQWPKNLPTYNEFGINLLKSCVNLKRPTPLTLQELLNNSEKFPIKFPINTCRIKEQPAERHQIIENDAATVYPIIHERTLWLYTRFLEHKLKYGNVAEKRVYTNMSLIEFVNRLLAKRCVYFYGKNDKFMLITGENGYSCYKEDTTMVAKEHPTSLDNLINYDEIKLSALLSISSYTEFINNGTRKNMAIVEQNKNRIERNGCIIGLIGARLSKPGFMEFQDIIISKEQNCTANGYGQRVPAPTTTKVCDYRRMWNEFYENDDYLFINCSKNEKQFDNCKNKNYIFNNVMMKKRYAIAFDTLLLDGQERGLRASKMVYIHVVGIGLGVWQYAPHQEELFLKVFEQRLKYLLPSLTNIGWIHFSWFQLSECGELKNGNVIRCTVDNDNNNNNGIKIYISKRNPADKLIGPEYKNALVFVSYAWDGNALPGNEFWQGKLSSTGDSASASCSLITELHNPHINETMANGNNLHIASPKHGILHIADYVKKLSI